MKGEKITHETEVSSTELACVLGITGRRVRQLAEDGQFEKTDGTFNLCDCVQRYLSMSKDTDSEEDKKLDQARRKAEVTLKASKAETARLNLKELQGKLHRSEDVEAMTTDLIFAVRGALMALPGRLAVDIVSVQTASEASELVKKEVYHIMNEISQYRYDPAKYEERVRQRLDWETGSGGEEPDE